MTISSIFQLEKASIDYSVKKLTLYDIEAKGSFHYGGGKNSELLNIKQFNGKVKSGKFKGNAIVKNFSNPDVKLDLSIQANISDFSSLLENKYLTDLKGNLIADIKYNGNYKKESRIDKQTTGQATFTGFGFVYNNKNISNLNGAVEFRDNKIFFDGLTCNIGTSDIKANGYIENLTNYILNEEKNIYASLNLFSDKLP